MSIIAGLWDSIELSASLTDMVDGVSGQVTELLPIGISLMFVLALPRIIKRVVNTFL